MKKTLILMLTLCVSIAIIAFFSSCSKNIDNDVAEHIDTAYITNLLQTYNDNWVVTSEEKFEDHLVFFKIEPKNIDENGVVPYSGISLSDQGKIRVAMFYLDAPFILEHSYSEDDISKAFYILTEVYGGFSDGSQIYESFLDDVENKNYTTNVDTQNNYQWHKKIDGVHCMVDFHLISDQEKPPIRINNIAYMSKEYFHTLNF